jgi:D-alanyl-D-alanine carboxypeptidase (penicillin-binding protein 5/6)
MMYRTYNARPIPQPYHPKRSRTGIVLFVVVLLILGAYITYALLRPLATVRTTVIPPVTTGRVKVNIPWPAKSQAAFGADGYGLLASNNEQKPTPTASVAKVVTALAVLDKKPLKHGEAGPLITLTSRDVDIYNDYIAKDGSAVPVFSGETISQYEAMQALMLPSANNIADTAAIWAFGSLEAYNTYANTMVKKLGMTRTTITDASGFAPTTVSTASDLIRLGDAALDHPVLSEIFGQKQATFPNIGTIDNVNTLLGQSGIRGIKTGNTDEAGGCLLTAADITIAGKKITVISAVMAAADLPTAMKESVPLVQSAVSQFQETAVVNSGQTVGHATSPWGSSTAIVADAAIKPLVWSGSALAPRVTTGTITAPATANTRAGSLELTYAGKTYATDLHTQSSVTGPTVWWRLAHPF